MVVSLASQVLLGGNMSQYMSFQLVSCSLLAWDILDREYDGNILPRNVGERLPEYMRHIPED
jgi:hypothetical protein